MPLQNFGFGCVLLTLSSSDSDYRRVRRGAPRRGIEVSRGHPPPPHFPYLFLINDLADGGFVSAHSKRVTGANFEANGANLVSAHSNGLSGFWLTFTMNVITDGDSSQ